MTIAYIILAHQNQEQLDLLINRLDYEYNYFFIHVDLKSNISDFEFLEKYNNVFLIKEREKCNWGGDGIVKATINLLKEASKINFKHVILLSAQDYPIKSNEYINSFLDDNVDYIDCYPMNSLWSDLLINKKIKWYKFDLTANRNDLIVLPPLFSIDTLLPSTFKAYYKLIISVLSKKTSLPVLYHIIRKLFKYREPYNMPIYGGSQWFCLTKLTVTRILNELKNDDSLISYHKYTLVPDEVFFSTIVKYLNEKYSDISIKKTITYVDWMRKGVPLPVTFIDDDIQILSNCGSDFLFARKICPKNFRSINMKLDRIENKII